MKKFISKELLIISENNAEINLNNIIYSNINEIKDNLISLENEMNIFFKKPFMRKKEKKVDKENINEEMKNKINEKNGKKEIINIINIINSNIKNSL